ncbi:MAG: 2-polyprenyl-3-methyl-6-methoxy-1,4-benzoquinone monooxygenase [Pusillimonas sp.]|nr:2-polyprenyl-3-methyl-6-methoxy-1,4-benzoquinone monooxygenase [Pusillimonas sp.]
MQPDQGFRRRFSPVDSGLIEVGKALEVLSGVAHATRFNPAGPPQADDVRLGDADRRHSAGLMRVNHVGEVCAQALYRGQAFFCRDASIQTMMHGAAQEEVDHLAWCNERLMQLNGHRSYLNPFWYFGSFALGALAGRAGTALNLGFMAETESQVEQHLNSHLKALPANDRRSREIVEQMRQDEIAHRQKAQAAGARKLPLPLRCAMKVMSKVMTTTAYRI